MAFTLNVPTIDSVKSAQALKETLLTSEPDANIEVDAESKTVSVKSEASEETFRELVVAAGHKVE